MVFYRLLVFLLTVAIIVDTTVVKLSVVNVQPFQPYAAGTETPCLDVTSEGCVAGFPAINALLRESEQGADGIIKVGDFAQITRLVQTHRLKYELNDVLWGRAGCEFLKFHAPYVLTLADGVVVSNYIRSMKLKLIASNIAEDDVPAYRGTLPHYHVTEPVPGIKVAVIVVWPIGYFVRTLPVDPTVSTLVRLIRSREGNVTIVAISPDVIEDYVLQDLHNANIDVITYPTPTPTDSQPAPSKFINQQTGHVTWKLQTTKMYHSVDVTTMVFDAGNKISDIRLESKSTATTMFVKDRHYLADEAFIQEIIDTSNRNDIKIVDSKMMPHGHLKFENASRFDSCRHEECHLGSLMTSAILQSSPLIDVVLFNGGALRSGWEAGKVWMSTLTNSFPYQNNICNIKLTAAELWRTLENGVSALTSSGDYNVSHPVSGKFLQVAGITYSFNPQLPIGKRVTGIRIINRKTKIVTDIDPRTIFNVATTNFICSGGDGFQIKPVDDSVETGVLDSWATVVQYLQLWNESNMLYSPSLSGSIVSNNDQSINIAKTAFDCGINAQYLPKFEDCQDCEYGYYHPSPGPSACIIKPAQSREISLLILLPVGGAILVMAAIITWLAYAKAKARRELKLKNAPRSGKIMLVFTDIQSSAKLWGEYPDEMAIALEAHHTLCRGLIDKHRGYEVKTIGDSFMVAFGSYSAAIAFICDFQLQLMKVRWPEALLQHSACAKTGVYNGLRVRAGLHYGECNVKKTPQGGFDYEGNAVNTCARVSDSGAGGQVLITEQAYEVIEGCLDGLDYGVDIKYLGQYRFKGINNPVDCYQILPEELANRSFSQLRNAEAISPNHSPLAMAVIAQSIGATLQQDPGDSRSVVSDDPAPCKKDHIAALQIIRKYLTTMSPGGAQVRYIASLLCLCVDQHAIPDVKLISSLIRHLVEIGNRNTNMVLQNYVNKSVSSTAKESRFSLVSEVTQFDASHIRWGALSELLRHLPTPCIVLIAQKVVQDRGEPHLDGKHSLAATIDAVVQRNPLIRSDDHSLTAPVFSEV